MVIICNKFIDYCHFVVFILGLGDMNSITSLSEEKEDIDGKSAKPKYMYIMSGAEGYIDFRIG